MDEIDVFALLEGWLVIFKAYFCEGFERGADEIVVIGVCCIFLFDSFYKFIIEECIFESSRPKKIISLNLTLSNCFDICSCLDCYEDIRLPIKEMFIRPIIEDAEDRI